MKEQPTVRTLGEGGKSYPPRIDFLSASVFGTYRKGESIFENLWRSEFSSSCVIEQYDGGCP